jgi:hypothetical protein
MIIIGTLFCSFLLQVGVNTLPYFFRYQLFALAGNEPSAAIEHYFDSRHFGTVDIEFLLYTLNYPSPMTEKFVAHLSSTEVDRLQLKRFDTRANYYWFPKVILREE